MKLTVEVVGNKNREQIQHSHNLVYLYIPMTEQEKLLLGIDPSLPCAFRITKEE